MPLDNRTVDLIARRRLSGSFRRPCFDAARRETI